MGTLYIASIQGALVLPDVINDDALFLQESGGMIKFAPLCGRNKNQINISYISGQRQTEIIVVATAK